MLGVWADRLARIDRRFLYLGLVVATLLPLVFRWRLPIYPSRYAVTFYQAVENCPTDGLVVVSTDWGASTLAENRPQSVAVFRHLLRRGIRFAIANIGTPPASRLGQQAAEDAIRLEGLQGKVRYGEQFVNFGYKFNEDAWMNSFARNIIGAVSRDWKGTPLREMPVMRGVEAFGKGVPLLVVITPSNSIDNYIGFMGPTGVKIALGCTAVMAPDQYGLLDSGQLAGLLTGMKGAAEYEALLNLPYEGTWLMPGQSFAHVYIILLILIGNLGMFLGRLAERRAR
jgi:hypothetical protein